MEAIRVFYCSECNTPLEIKPNDDRYCNNCKYAPSMEDTFIKMECPNDRAELERSGDQWKCPQCKAIYD